MEEKGWKIRVISEREIEPPQGVTADQVAVYQRDSNTCTESFEQEYPPPEITAVTVRDLYKQELATMTCLQKLGIQVDAPPSEQAYVDEYLTQRFSHWTAYAHVTEFADMPFGEVERKCPQPELRQLN